MALSESRAMSATGREAMRKLTVTFIATAAILLAGSLAFKADAQTSRGAANKDALKQIPEAKEKPDPWKTMR